MYPTPYALPDHLSSRISETVASKPLRCNYALSQPVSSQYQYQPEFSQFWSGESLVYWRNGGGVHPSGTANQSFGTQFTEQAAWIRVLALSTSDTTREPCGKNPLFEEDEVRREGDLVRCPQTNCGALVKWGLAGRSFQRHVQRCKAKQTCPRCGSRVEKRTYRLNLWTHVFQGICECWRRFPA